MNVSKRSRVAQSVRIVSLLSVLFFALTVLSGCDIGIDPPAVPGQFIDSPVQGLAYQTATQEGTTDNEGTFWYKRREDITFSVGGVLLGQVTDKKTVTPFDLVPGATDDSDPAVINICRFLQSLDEDGNPANGINITPQTAALLEGQNITSEDLTESLMQDILDTLNAAGVFSANTPRQLVSAEEAHNHFLLFLQTNDNDNDRSKDALDCNDIDPTIKPGAKEICEDGVDQDCDGIDPVCTTTTTTSSTTSTTLISGDTTTTTVPGGTTGTTTSTTTTTLPGGTTTTSTTTTTITSSTTTTTIPSSGNWVLTESLMDEDNDGSIDEHRYYYYDDDEARSHVLYDLGYLVADRWDREEIDWFADGTIDIVRDQGYAYDSNGRLETLERDEDTNGTIDDVYYYTYGSNGNLASEGIDLGNDGMIDEVSYFNYDGNGNLVSAVEDFANDGTIDSVSYLNLDSNGNWVSVDADEDNNGTIDAVIHIIYDSNGNWKKWETDEGNDGTIDEVEYYFWSGATTSTSALVGGWLYNPGLLADSAVVTFIDDTNYIFAMDGDPDDDGGRGMERGIYTWNPSSGAFGATVLSGTAGDWGFSDSNDITVTIDGNILNFIDSEQGLIPLVKISSETNPIVGSWLNNPGTLADSAVVTFIDDTNYIFAVDGDPDDGGGRGMERGTYTWNPSSGAFTATAVSGSAGDWGISYLNDVTVTINGNTLNFIDSVEGLIPFTKVQ